MAQWLGVCLPVQGTRVRAPVWEDPTCRGATKARAPQLLRLCSRACEPQLLSPHATTTEAHVPGACAPQREATAMGSPRTATKSDLCSPQLGKAHAQQRRPNAANNKSINKFIFFKKWHFWICHFLYIFLER